MHERGLAHRKKIHMIDNRLDIYQIFEDLSPVSWSTGIENVEAGEKILAEVDEALVAAFTSGGAIPTVAQNTHQNEFHLKKELLWKNLIEV